jgi:hypothetical protein
MIALAYNVPLGTPTFSEGSGVYSGTQTISITFPSGSVGCVGINTVPTAPVTGTCGPGGTQYTGPIAVTPTETLGAIATKANYVNSPVVSATYTAPPTVTLSASSLSFGTLAVGAKSASQHVTLTNTGGLALTITSIALGGVDASSFMFKNSCGSSLAAGASCTIHGHFMPLLEGALTAAVTITDSSSNSPQTIALSGTGGTPPAVSLSGTSLTFADQGVGTNSTSQQITLTNTGQLPLIITNIGVTGANASSFVFLNTCGTEVAAGASCTIHGHSTPTTTGALTAAVTITDNAVDSPQSIALTGTGQ